SSASEGGGSSSSTCESADEGDSGEGDGDGGGDKEWKARRSFLMGGVFTVGLWYPLDNNASLAARARFMALARLARDLCAPSSSGFWRGCGWAMVTRLGGYTHSALILCHRCRGHVYHMPTGILADDNSLLAEGRPNLSPIDAVQRTKEMKKKIFATFSHTPKRLPNRFHFWFHQRKKRHIYMVKSGCREQPGSKAQSYVNTLRYSLPGHRNTDTTFNHKVGVGVNIDAPGRGLRSLLNFQVSICMLFAPAPLPADPSRGIQRLPYPSFKLSFWRHLRSWIDTRHMGDFVTSTLPFFYDERGGGQSFEEVRFADYLKSYRATGRPPPSSPPYPSEPKARAAQGLPPLFTPVTLPAVPSSSSPSSTVPSTTSSPAAIATPLSTAAIPTPTRPGVQPTVTPMGRLASESPFVNPSGSGDKASTHPTPMGGFVSGGLFGNLSSSGDKAGVQPMPTNRFTSTPSPFTSGSLLGHFQPPASSPSTSSGGGNIFRFGDKAGAQPTSTNGFAFTPPPSIRPFTLPPSRFTSGTSPSSLSAGFGDGNRFNSGDKAGTEPMSTNEFERTSSHLAKNLGGIEKVEQERDVMEMARTSEQIRRHELDELLRAQQAETDSGMEEENVYVSPPAATKAFYDISVALSLYPPTIGPGAVEGATSRNRLGRGGGYIYVSPPAATKAFYDISVALSLSPPTIGPQGRVRRAVLDDWVCGIMELHAELSRDRKLQSEAEQMFTELAESLEEIKKVEQEREGELARHRQEILDQQSEIKHTSSQLAQSLGKIEKVEQERDVVEMACKSERMRRVELEEQLRERQTGVGILQDDLAKLS
ncbi:hypothetical protein B0H13DRAFT_1908228, partial [Mycena leptocephala]